MTFQRCVSASQEIGERPPDPEPLSAEAERSAGLVAEIQFSGFSYLAFHQLESHAARLRCRSQGSYYVPKVLRMPYAGGVRALEHHSESREAGELIAEGVLAIEMGAVATDLALSIHPHPTLSETIEESAAAFLGHPTHILPSG